MKWKSKVIKLLIALSALFVLFILSSFLFLNKIKHVKIPDDNNNLGINIEEQNNKMEAKVPEARDLKNQIENKDENYLDGKILNIVLLGGDRRRKEEISHTDSIIIVSVDGIHKKIKVSSIMRDTYVKVHGHGKTKLNHAYVYGGPGLVIRTLNENFGLDIRDFVFIDFYGFEKLIDSVGGVEVEVKKNEIGETNYRIKEMAVIRKTKPCYIKGPGLQILNGQQALAYSRIRKIGNGDYDRTERQRRVLASLFNKISEIGILRYPFLVAKILPYTETSLTNTEILQIGTYILASQIKTIEQRRFPEDENCRGKIIGDIWYLVTDINATRKKINQFIYEKDSSVFNSLFIT